MNDAGEAYLACIQAAAAGGAALMNTLIGSARTPLFQRISAAADPRARNGLQDALHLLNQHEPFLCRRFAELLLTEFTAAASEPAPAAAPAATTPLRFDLLELMDEVQVQERVELARIQQAVLLATEAELSDLNCLICGARGLSRVDLEGNPMRPEVYARCLRESVRQTGVAPAVSLLWMQFLGQALGQALATTYHDACRQLQERGIEPAPYQVTQSPGGGRADANARSTGVAAARHAGPAAVSAASQRVMPGRNGSGRADSDADGPDTDSARLLTLTHLRRLLAGELPEDDSGGDEAANPAPARRPRTAAPARPGAAAPTFAPTVPAAFEVLAEMQQVETVMQRLASRRQQAQAGNPASGDNDEAAPPSSLRARLRSEAKGLGQALGLEVVSLMVDNIVADERLAPPVRAAVSALEPALMRLALADPRFFSDRKHAARQLLDQVTQRGLAFASAQAPGFEAFMTPVQSAVEAVAAIADVSPELFELALAELGQEWERLAAKDRQRQQKALKALLQAEQRKLLAGQISHELRGREALQHAPAAVVALLLGPWSQVMARDRLAHPDKGLDPGGYGALVTDLIWSTRFDLDRAGRERLLKLIPALITKLRQGLSSIDFPPERLQAVLDELMALHQQCLKPGAQRRSLSGSDKAGAPPAAAGATAASTAPPLKSRAELQAQFDAADASGVWLVEQEARDSGFMDYPTQAEASLKKQGYPSATDIAAITRVGVWIEVAVDGQWLRSRLSWASPQGTLFLFAGTSGPAHSMSLRTLERLLADSKVRLLASETPVDGALDAVAQAALRNSVDSVF